MESADGRAAPCFTTKHMAHYSYKTQGTCSRMIDIEVDDAGVITGLNFTGGCNGNLKGICALAKGHKAADVKALLGGITCGGKMTSCPDQLAKALEDMGY